MLQHADCALEEARLLYGLDQSAATNGQASTLPNPSAPRYFGVLSRTPKGTLGSKMFSTADVEQVMRAMRHTPDAYISQGTFVSRQRRIATLSTLNACWVDLDCYNVGATPSQGYVEELIDATTEMGIPRPSYVVRSGRGLYLKWIFSRAVDASQLPKWNALQRSLVRAYKRLGGDFKSRDAARVLRALGSRNSKVDDSRQSVVETVWLGGFEQLDFTSMCDSVRVAEIVGRVPESASVSSWADELAQEELRATRAERARQRIDIALLADRPSRTDLAALRTYAALREPIMMSPLSGAALNWKRFIDLRDLAIARGGVREGERDLYLFWMLNSLAHAGVVTPANFNAEVGALASLIDPENFDPQRDDSMGAIFRRMTAMAQQRAKARTLGTPLKLMPGQGLYRPSNATLIEAFNIRPEEQEGLATIISPEEVQRRRDVTCPGRAERRIKRHAQRAEVIRLAEAGASLKEIEAATGMRRQQIYRLRDRLATLGDPAAVAMGYKPLKNVDSTQAANAPGAGLQKQVPSLRDTLPPNLIAHSQPSCEPVPSCTPTSEIERAAAAKEQVLAQGNDHHAQLHQASNTAAASVPWRTRLDLRMTRALDRSRQAASVEDRAWIKNRKRCKDLSSGVVNAVTEAIMKKSFGALQASARALGASESMMRRARKKVLHFIESTRSETPVQIALREQIATLASAAYDKVKTAQSAVTAAQDWVNQVEQRITRSLSTHSLLTTALSRATNEEAFTDYGRRARMAQMAAEEARSALAPAKATLNAVTRAYDQLAAAYTAKTYLAQLATEPPSITAPPSAAANASTWSTHEQRPNTRDGHGPERGQPAVAKLSAAERLRSLFSSRLAQRAERAPGGPEQGQGSTRTQDPVAGGQPARGENGLAGKGRQLGAAIERLREQARLASQRRFATA